MATHKPYFKPHFTIFLSEAGVAVGGWRGVVEEESRKGGKSSPDENPKSVCPAAAAEA